ncbi:NUDIX domain-containing protein [Bacillus sp. Bva_UNVM-123]|uniref:NUDIX hydrolase n=1 Tax=Bacillus sp. Bva_UNVM-123 TaxID=2829798 RepID=UPI00391F8679
MESELLKIFDEHKNQIGIATREEVHRLGHWHEAFHCWFVSIENRTDYVYLQIRSENKKDYPNLYDITAAGHLLANETIDDGVREIKEELGIEVTIRDLVPLGQIKYCVLLNNFIDKEFASVFLYKSKNDFHDFILQKEEVSGIVKAKFNDFTQLWFGEIDEIHVEGFEINHSGSKSIINKKVNKSDFVPHDSSYYKSVIEMIKMNL